MKAKRNYMTPDVFEYVDMEAEFEELNMSLTEDEADELGIEWEDTWGDTLTLTFSRQINELRKPVSDYELVKAFNSFDEPTELGLVTSLIVEDHVNNEEV